MQVCHVGVKVCFPLGVERIRIDACADIVQLHFGCIADVHAVDLDGSKQQHEGHQHGDCEDDEDGKEGHIAPFIPDDFLKHGAPPISSNAR